MVRAVVVDGTQPRVVGLLALAPEHHLLAEIARVVDRPEVAEELPLAMDLEEGLQPLETLVVEAAVAAAAAVSLGVAMAVQGAQAAVTAVGEVLVVVTAVVDPAVVAVVTEVVAVTPAAAEVVAVVQILNSEVAESMLPTPP